MKKVRKREEEEMFGDHEKTERGRDAERKRQTSDNLEELSPKWCEKGKRAIKKKKFCKNQRIVQNK